MIRQPIIEKEFGEKLMEMLDAVIEIYSNAKLHLDNGDYRAAEKQLDSADRIVDNINTLLRGK